MSCLPKTASIWVGDTNDFKSLERWVSKEESYRGNKLVLLGPKLLKCFAYVVDIHIK